MTPTELPEKIQKLLIEHRNKAPFNIPGPTQNLLIGPDGLCITYNIPESQDKVLEMLELGNKICG